MRYSFLLFLFFLSFFGFSQEILIKKQLDNQNPIFSNFTSSDSLNFSNFWMYSPTSDKESVYNLNDMEDLEGDIAARGTNDYDNDPYVDNPPSEMLDKFPLRPKPNNLNGNISLNEDLRHGKLNVSIPLFTYKYYDYTIPVILQNRYPQALGGPYEIPTFYLGSRVGAGWNLNVENYKVSRTLKGLPDEDEDDGYFSSHSQSKISKVLNENLSNSELRDGLEGEWDTGLDVFNFSIPNLNGTFVLNLNTGGYQILSKNANFKVDYEVNNGELRSFTITDSNGIRFLFGGEDSSIETFESKSDISNYGFLMDGYSRKKSVKYIVEMKRESNGELTYMSHVSLPGFSNYFIDFIFSGAYSTQTPDEVLQGIISSNYINQNQTKLIGIMGSPYYDREVYAIPQTMSPPRRKIQDVFDDPDLRNDRMNSAWYLSSVTLPNRKVIELDYARRDIGYITLGNSKTKTPLKLYNTFYYPRSGSDDKIDLNGIYAYSCFPRNLSVNGPYPINESSTFSYNFSKKPFLVRIKDEDNFSEVNLQSYTFNSANIDKHVPFFRDANLLSYTPNDMVGNWSGITLLDKVQLKIMGQVKDKVEFENRVTYASIEYNNGDAAQFPWLDRSWLDQVLINDKKKYSISYEGDRLKSIIYPTGAQKEFYYTNLDGTTIFYNSKFSTFNGGNIKAADLDYVDKVVTTTQEGNVTTEEFEFSEDHYHSVNAIYKMYRPDTYACQGKSIFSSTSPIYDSHAIHEGLYFENASKFLNGVLQYSKEFSAFEGDYNAFGNELILTPESSNSFNLGDMSRPPSWNYQMLDNFETTQVFKVDEEEQLATIEKTEINREYFNEEPTLPSVYLTQLEVGPWNSTPGAIKTAYSKYSYFTNSFLEKETINRQEYYNSVVPLEYFSENEYRFRESSLYNSKKHYLYSSLNIDPLGDEYKMKNITMFEAEMISGSGGFSLDNPTLDQLAKNNQNPVLESVSYKNDRIVSATATKFKVKGNPPLNPFVLPEKKFSLDVPGNLYDNNFSQQHTNYSSNELVFDDRYTEDHKFDKYDDYGRLLRYVNKSEKQIDIVWGYSNQLPLVKIMNSESIDETDIDGLRDQVSNTDFSPNNYNDNILSLIESFVTQHENKNVYIEYYLYEKGRIVSKFDARGIAENYNYNEHGELVSISDDNNKIIEAYKYNYKTNSNYTINYDVSEINWINKPPGTYYLSINNNEKIMCNIIASGGSGDYSYYYEFTNSSGNVLKSGNTYNTILYLNNQSVTGDITLTYTVTDNYTDISYTRTRDFYVYQDFQGVNTLYFDDIQENILSSNHKISTATVTSSFTDTLRFWVFNQSSAGTVSVQIEGQSYEIGHYQTKTIEVPVQANQTIQCQLSGQGNFNSCMLEIKPPLNGTANPESPKVLNLNHD